ncbi:MULTISPECIES: helix-turn-helix domain-containing protein [Pseudofrankia]|uniref:helix-turn-helix domain-containing protein n=1 Tax=Pseudofrankia TaxID=2994363 RepID=UPI000234C1F9|nr:hypothetical protein BCD49_29400 [Pseudofrankia sp. EUN1h]
MTKSGERHLRAVHEDWRSVATALGARMSTRRVSQQELALAAGVSVATLRVLQRGNSGRRVQNSTLSAVSRALGWPDDHLVRILLGDQYPGPATSEGTHPGDPSAPPGPAAPTAGPADETYADRPAGEPPSSVPETGPAAAEPSVGERTTPRVVVTRQPAGTAPADLPEQILLTLRRIERRVEDIARHLVRA